MCVYMYICIYVYIYILCIYYSHIKHRQIDRYIGTHACYAIYTCEDVCVHETTGLCTPKLESLRPSQTLKGYGGWRVASTTS